MTQADLELPANGYDQQGGDRNGDRQRQACTQVVHRPIATGPHDHQIGLVTDRGHERKRSGNRNGDDVRPWMVTRLNGEIQGDGEHDGRYRRIGNHLGQHNGRKINHQQ